MDNIDYLRTISDIVSDGANWSGERSKDGRAVELSQSEAVRFVVRPSSSESSGMALDVNIGGTWHRHVKP